MGTSIAFFVPGKPQGKARARTVHMPNGAVRSFTPDKTVLYENFIKACYLDAYKKTGLLFPEGVPVDMSITVNFGIPKSVSKKRAAAMAGNEILPTKKPDIDNVAKVVADALNGVAYRDDTQVVKLSVVKRYCDVSRCDPEGLRITLKTA